MFIMSTMAQLSGESCVWAKTVCDTSFKEINKWSGCFCKAVARAMMFMGVLRYLHRLGFGGQMDLAWDLAQFQQVWMN